jgi:hypothetical protein
VPGDWHPYRDRQMFLDFEISLAFRFTQTPDLLAEMGHIAGTQPPKHRISPIHMAWIRRAAFF